MLLSRRLLLAALPSALLAVTGCATTSASSSAAGAAEAPATTGAVTAATEPQPVAASQAAAAPQVLRFGWPVPTRVPVHSTVLKRGKRAAVRYEAVLTPAGAGREGYALRVENLEVLEHNGKDLRADKLTPEERQGLEMARGMLSAVPVVYLSQEGEYADVEGMEATVERLIKAVAGDDKRQKALRSIVSSPQAQAGLRATAGETWNLWVGAWNGVEVTENGTQTVTSPTELPGGSTVDARLTLRHLGTDAAHPGSVRLELETLYEGEAFRRSIAAFLTQMFSQTAAATGRKDAPDMDKALKHARKRILVRAVLDPATLRPYSVHQQTRTTMVMEGQPERTEEEEKSFTFDWAKASRNG